MKRIILLLFAAVMAFSSCENLEDNSPALQSEIDSIFFKANDVRGQENEDGSFTLQGINQDQKLTLNLDKSLIGVYPVGGGEPSSATWEDASGDLYTTAPFGEGNIEISDRCVSCGWLTGNFRFTAKRSELDSVSVRVQKGFFFEVSYLNGNVDDTGPSLGIMTATVNGNPFEANSVTIDEDSGTITFMGFQDSSIITIQVPSGAVSGNYVLPQPGYSASYTINNVTTEAENGGVVSVNFNNTQDRTIRVLFSFTAGENVITQGTTSGTY